MTIQIKHPFVSAKGDGTDATLVRPSNWNALHSTSMASGNLLGRLTAGAGVFEEIPISTYMAGLLGTLDQAALAAILGVATTGAVQHTFATTAPTGWMLVTANGTIGDASSAGTLRANADTQALWLLIYGSCSDAIAPVSGGRSGVALTDYNAHKTLTIPSVVGRAIIGAGSAGTGTSARTLGSVVGTETHTLDSTQIPGITSTGTVTITVYGRTNVGGFFPNSSPNTTYMDTLQGTGGGGTTNFTYTNNPSFASTNTGGLSHPNMQPSTALNTIVKL